jgi:hypothetical protein
MYSNAKHGSSTLGEVHIRELLLLINSPTAHAELSLPGKITAKLERNTVSMMADGAISAEEETPVYSTRAFNPKSDDEEFEEYIETDDVADNFIIEDAEDEEDDDMFGDVYEDEFSDFADED